MGHDMSRLCSHNTHAGECLQPQGVEGASPMFISGMSPALGSQHLLRTGSLAAVTSGYQDPSATPGLVCFPWQCPAERVCVFSICDHMID